MFWSFVLNVIPLSYVVILVLISKVLLWPKRVTNKTIIISNSMVILQLLFCKKATNIRRKSDYCLLKIHLQI